MTTFVPVLAPATLVLALVSGCARTAEERQLDAMRADIDRIQEDRDRTDRSNLGSDPSEPPPTAGAGAAVVGGPTPAQDTVQVAGDAPDDDYADPDDNTPRPRIRVFGSPRVSGRDVEQVDDAVTSPGEPARLSPLDPDAKRAYDAAMSLVAAKKYDAALDGFAAFLVKWPEHPYADHAMYWRGECYFAAGDFAHASEQFEGVLARFPAGSKVPDALLKLGMSQQRLGNAAKADECFQRLTREFPQSEAARHVPVAPAEGNNR
jgi:tol-pal system protein YbgF